MGLAAAAFAKATRRRQILVCTSSVGPGATNMVPAAGVAMANRLPVLFIAGDTFNSRLPDPVLQQVEHFGSPSSTVNDAFKDVRTQAQAIAKIEDGAALSRNPSQSLSGGLQYLLQVAPEMASKGNIVKAIDDDLKNNPQLLQELAAGVFIGPILNGFEYSVQIVQMGSSASQILKLAAFAAIDVINA
jgi:hypothetical protein